MEGNEYSYQSNNNTTNNKKKGGFFKKMLAVIVLGSLFGSCTAGAFYGVSKIYNLDLDLPFIDSGKDTETENLQKQIDELQKALDTRTIASAVTDSGNGSTSTLVTLASTDVTQVAEKVMPSMVAVTNNYEQRVSDFWGRSYVQQGDASGSGIIVGESDSEYFIATNHHVIDSAKSLSVQFVDETTADAYVKGYNSEIDIAVIAVQKSEISASTMNAIAIAEIGDSDTLKIGETAIAIGNALGYGQSVTTGVISALNRTIEDSDYSAQNLIQTSAAINPGNSGGALLNALGQVIGINSSKIGGDTVEGMGFAIPINEVKDLILEYSERETRFRVATEDQGYLGILGDLEKEGYATYFGYPKGALVSSVQEGSAAEEAGLYANDIITAVDDVAVSSFNELKEAMAYYSVGDTVKLTVARLVNGNFDTLEFTVTLRERPATTE